MPIAGVISPKNTKISGESMKILLISNMYPSQKYPHYGVFVKNTEEVLEQIPGVAVKRVVMGKQDGKFHKLATYFRFYMQAVLRGVFGKYDVIYGHFISHVAMPVRMIKALNPKVKIVLNAHGNDVVADMPRDEKWVALSRKVIPLADSVIVPSKYYRDVLHNAFDVPEEKLLVYPSGGINTHLFAPQDPEKVCEKFGLDRNKRYVGYVSRIEKNKGWDTFLGMAAQLKTENDLGFIVVGDGSEVNEFQEMAQQLGVEEKIVRFPLLSQQEIAQLYSVLDVFCFPTYRKSESLGLVGLEAMACGCLVVASNVYGPSSYMENGVNGFTVSPNQPQALADGVKKALCLDTDQREKIKSGMAKTVAAYSRETVDGILQDFFRGLS